MQTKFDVDEEVLLKVKVKKIFITDSIKYGVMHEELHLPIAVTEGDLVKLEEVPVDE